MAYGRVIVLNGTSSAGKTTLATKLQALFAEAGECWIVIGIDDLLSKLPAAWVTYGRHVGAHAEAGIAFEEIDGEVELRVGPIGAQTLAVYRGTVARAALAGLNVIVDEVLLSGEDWDAWQVELEGLDVVWVRVDCALELLEDRERSRGDRMVGLARAQFEAVHLHPTYLVTADTGATSPDEVAALVYAAVARGGVWES